MSSSIVKKSGGYGVNGGRYDFQIDYNPQTGSSEVMAVDFVKSVEDIVLTLHMMEEGEWKGYDETGFWEAFDRGGNKIGYGVLSPETGRSGSDSDIHMFEINVDGARIDRLQISATEYGDETGTSRLDNNSDFQILDIDYVLI